MRNWVEHPVTAEELNKYLARRRNDIEHYQCIGDMRMLYYSIMEKLVEKYKTELGDNFSSLVE